MGSLGAFLAGGGAVMRGINQGNDEASARTYLDAVRTGTLEQQGLNLEEARAAATDRRRDRSTTDAMRSAAQGVNRQRVVAQQANATATAARSDALGGIGASTQGLDGYDPPKAQPEPGRADTFQAMRDAAMQAGDAARATQIDQITAKLKQEGFLDMTKAALMGAPPTELEKIFNDANGGTMKYAPGTLKVSPEGIISGVNAATGQPTQPFGVHKLAVMTGLVKPDDWEVKDGFAVNKRTGVSKWVGGMVKQGETAVGADGKLVAAGEKTYPPNQRYMTIKDADGAEHLVDLLGGGAASGPAAPGAPSAATPGNLPPPLPISTKVRKEISDEIDAGYKGAMGELTGTAAVRDKAKVLGNNLYAANKDPDKGMTPQLASTIARQVAEGALKPKQATDAAGNVWNVVEYEGKLYPIDRQPAMKAPGAQALGGAGTSVEPPPQAVEYLKANPGAAPAFKQKYGVDPQKYLAKPAKAATKVSTPLQVASNGVLKTTTAEQPTSTEDPEPTTRFRGRSETKEWKAWKARQDEREAEFTRARMQRNAVSLRDRSLGVIQP